MLKIIIYQLSRTLRSVFQIDVTASRRDIITHAYAEAEIRGHKSWILAAAILIASLGLNANSTAVVIGAMLISPLMGPVVGIGIAVRMWDLGLLQRSVKSLGLSIVVSMIVSTLFFVLSPFVSTGDELTARTTPTLLDALIAVFGGVAGAVAILRKERTNVVPGVAIATALMPPLCTAGYGIATGQLPVLLGAFYLFFINSVCISATTYAVLHLVDVHEVVVDQEITRKRHRWIVAFVIVAMVPALLISVNMIQMSLFERRVDRFIARYRGMLPASSVIVTRRDLKVEEPLLDLVVIGTTERSRASSLVDSLRKDLGLERLLISVHALDEQMSQTQTAIPEIVTLYQSSEKQRTELRKVVDSLHRKSERDSMQQQQIELLREEILLVYPEIAVVNVSRLASSDSAGVADRVTYRVDVTWKRPPSSARARRFSEWMRMRLADPSAQIRANVRL